MDKAYIHIVYGIVAQSEAAALTAVLVRMQREIEKLRALIKQKAEQKIDIADQVAETVEAHVRMLKAEMEKFQRELEQNGDYERVAGRVGEQVGH